MYKQWKEKKGFNGNGDYKKKANVIEQSKEFLFNIVTTKNNGWIVDSGATSHVTNDKRLLEMLKTDMSKKVYMANGNKVCVKGKGTCKFKMMNSSGDVSDAKLTNILFPPQITGNMIPVSKLTDNGFELHFKRDYYFKIVNNNIEIL